MKIRRYMGNNLQEAILKVKMDLGNDALILNTRKVRQKGLFKLFSKPMTEVLAAMDEYSGGVRKEQPAKPQTKEQQQTTKAADSEPVVQKDEKITNLEDKVQNMEKLLEKIYTQMQPSENKAAVAATAEKPAPVEENQQPNLLNIFYNNLVKNEVETDIAKEVTDMVSIRAGRDSGPSETASLIYNSLCGLLGKSETINLKPQGPTVIIFVGPTGVGKTTTLAKIAATYLLNQKKSVGLITADTYRIAAIEQLKTYAEILGIPISVIYSPSEIREAVTQYFDKDIILIDTAGRSHTNKPQFEELKSLVALSGADEVFLVLSATTGLRSIKEILKHYSFLENYKLIFTKTDEAPTTGVIFNTCYLTGKKLSYITNGQNVPDDIEVANVDKLTKNVMGSLN